jgi:predicted ATPase
MPRTIVWPAVSDHPPQLERVDWHPSAEHPPDLASWPFTIRAVLRLIEDGGFEIPPGITFLVGENGSGKSTLVEAFAAVYPRRGFETPDADKLELDLARSWRTFLDGPDAYLRHLLAG